MQSRRVTSRRLLTGCSPQISPLPNRSVRVAVTHDDRSPAMGTTTATAARPTFDVPRLSLAEVAAMPSEQLQEMLAESASAQASLAGFISLALAELSRRQAFRADGATSAEAWMVERTGVGLASARTWAGVGERLFDLPHLSEA